MTVRKLTDAEEVELKDVMQDWSAWELIDEYLRLLQEESTPESDRDFWIRKLKDLRETT